MKHAIKYITIFIVCIALYFAIYPFYIRWIAGNYAKKFSNVLDSHDMKMYDGFFSKETIFDLNGKQIKYIDAKKNMQKVQSFNSAGSYGCLEEWYDYRELIMVTCLRSTYTVDFYLSISDYHDGERIFIEGEMILKRKWIFFFDIEKIIFDEEEEGERFLKDFLGI